MQFTLFSRKLCLVRLKQSSHLNLQGSVQKGGTGAERLTSMRRAWAGKVSATLSCRVDHVHANAVCANARVLA